MSSGTFNWQSLGKPDYAQAAALVASLPLNLRHEIEGGARETLCRLLHLMWRFAEKSGRGIGYCWPSERWLAQQLGRSVRTVRRYIMKLASMGLIAYRRRTTAGGAWTSNLYQMGKTMLASLFARKGQKTQQIRDRTKMADNDLKREYKADAPPSGKPFIPPAWMLSRAMRQDDADASPAGSAHMVETLKKAGITPKGYVPVPDEWDIADAKQSENERRELLKRQAEKLKARGL